MASVSATFTLWTLRGNGAPIRDLPGRQRGDGARSRTVFVSGLLKFHIKAHGQLGHSTSRLTGRVDGQDGIWILGRIGLS